MRILYKPTNNMLASKGVRADGSRTAKMKSLAGATHILVDEADELGEEEFDQMDLSLRTVKSLKVQIIRVFNPPGKTHWIWRDYNLTEAGIPGYFRAEPKHDSSVFSIFATYKDNLRNLNSSSIEKFESFRKNPEYYNTVILGLISEGMRGRIFSGWQPCTDQQFDDLDLPIRFGQDFGSSSPAPLVGIKRQGNRVYVREYNYAPATEKELAIIYCKLRIKDEVIIADSAEPFKITRLRRGWTRTELPSEEADRYPMLLQGFNIYGAIKPKGSVVSGIDQIKDLEVYVTESSTNIWLEYREYRWALDKNKNPTDEPEDANNHAMDALSYVIRSKGRFY
jgi:phage terminase large subunit